MFQKKPSASEVDGVQYRRAKLWQIICYACNAFVGMSVYSLIGMASYSASIGYGITTATVGIILMLARILDGFTDPMLAIRLRPHQHPFRQAAHSADQRLSDRGCRPAVYVQPVLQQGLRSAGVCPDLHYLHHRLYRY